MKKIGFFLVIVGLFIGVFAGCSNNTSPSSVPKDTVDGFLTAIQKGDYEKARTFVEGTESGFKLDDMTKTVDGVDGKEIMDAVTKQYKFENITEVSNKDNKAEVKVKITSVDFAHALGKTVGDVMAMTMADAMSGSKQPSEKEMEEKVLKELIKNLSETGAKTVTREVTLTLNKDKDGNFKIVSNDQLGEVILANWKELDKVFAK
nr:hypothetical protein [Priestia taiwanensis]